MSESNLGKTLFIVNPASQSGRGKHHAEVIEKYLRAHPHVMDEHTMHLTSGPKEAIEVASEAQDFDTVVALGGDGIIHEVVNGLMKIDDASRPALGIIPVGTGNDYARTLGIAINHPIEALKQLTHAKPRKIDVGLLQTDVEKRYFMQTLSFGIDAAIAHDTTKRRASGTKSRGENLFFTSGLKLFSKARKGWPCKVVFDDTDTAEFQDIVFAIHIGPTYGGGFKITPHADPTNGKFAICHNISIPRLVITTLLTFLSIKAGNHVKSKMLTLREARKVQINFVNEVAPVQVDGEEVEGTEFIATVVPAALKVYASEDVKW